MSDDDPEQRLSSLARASDSLRARPGFKERALLAALSSAPAGFALELARSLRRAVPAAVLAAALSVLWAVLAEQSADEAFAAADDSVELEW